MYKKIKIRDKIPENFEKRDGWTYVGFFVENGIGEYETIIEKFLDFVELTEINPKSIVFVTSGRNSSLVERLALELRTKIIEIVLKTQEKGSKVGMYKSVVDFVDYVVIIVREKVSPFLEEYTKSKKKPIFIFKAKNNVEVDV